MSCNCRKKLNSPGKQATKKASNNVLVSVSPTHNSVGVKRMPVHQRLRVSLGRKVRS